MSIDPHSAGLQPLQLWADGWLRVSGLSAAAGSNQFVVVLVAFLSASTHPPTRLCQNIPFGFPPPNPHLRPFQ